MGAKRATPIQFHLIGNLLSEHAAKENGYCIYEEGWSDERIAAEVGSPLASVVGMRLEMKGKTRIPVPPEMKMTTKERVNALEERVERLERAIRPHASLFEEAAE